MCSVCIHLYLYIILIQTRYPETVCTVTAGVMKPARLSVTTFMVIFGGSSYTSSGQEPWCHLLNQLVFPPVVTVITNVSSTDGGCTLHKDLCDRTRPLRFPLHSPKQTPNAGRIWNRSRRSDRMKQRIMVGFFPQRQGATDTKPFLNKGIYAAGRRIKKNKSNDKDRENEDNRQRSWGSIATKLEREKLS